MLVSGLNALYCVVTSICPYDFSVWPYKVIQGISYYNTGYKSKLQVTGIPVLILQH